MELHFLPKDNAYATDLMVEAVKFFAKELISPIRLELIEMIADFDANLDKGIEGDATELKRHHYRVRIQHDLSLERALLCLAHEMVHVKQFACNELQVITRSVAKSDYIAHEVRVKWMGKYFATEGVHYDDYPWEIEAKGKELDLTLAFVNKDRLTRRLARKIQKQYST